MSGKKTWNPQLPTRVFVGRAFKIQLADSRSFSARFGGFCRLMKPIPHSWTILHTLQNLVPNPGANKHATSNVWLYVCLRRQGDVTLYDTHTLHQSSTFFFYQKRWKSVTIRWGRNGNFNFPSIPWILFQRTP